MSVNVVDAEKFNNPDVWPVGVCVRRWRSGVLTNKHRTMANEQLCITTYNCKHFHDSGDKFDFMNKLMCDSEFLFLQEICLYETALNKLLKLGHNSDMMATSAMDESIQRIGRSFGDVAIIWNSSIKNKLVKIYCISNWVCGLLYGENDSLTMLLNVYMSCDKNTYDHVFINV